MRRRFSLIFGKRVSLGLSSALEIGVKLALAVISPNARPSPSGKKPSMANPSSALAPNGVKSVVGVDCPITFPSPSGITKSIGDSSNATISVSPFSALEPRGVKSDEAID